MMRRLQGISVGFFTFVFLMGGNCSRTRVDSINRMNEGVVLASQKQYLQAEEKLQSATTIDPSNHEAFWNLAIVHMEMHKFARAREDLQRAIEVDGEIAGYHEKLGTVLIELEDYEGAEESFRAALALDDNLFKAHYKLGQVLERLGNQQDALREYTRAIETGPRFIEGYRALGRMYADLGYLDESVQVLEAGLQVVIAGTEDEAHLHHLLGTVFQQREELDRAIEQFRQALELMPSLREAQFALGWAYSLQGNREEARRHLQGYVDGAGSDAPPHYLSAARNRLAELAEP